MGDETPGDEGDDSCNDYISATKGHSPGRAICSRSGILHWRSSALQLMDCRFSFFAWPKTDEAAVNGNVIFQHPSRIHLTITLHRYFFKIVVARVEETGIQAKSRKMKALLRTHPYREDELRSLLSLLPSPPPCILECLENEKAPKW